MGNASAICFVLADLAVGQETDTWFDAVVALEMDTGMKGPLRGHILGLDRLSVMPLVYCMQICLAAR